MSDNAPMYTQCPKCNTYFRVTDEHLKAAHGKVRCGQCKHVFNGRKYLTKELPSNEGDDHDEGLPTHSPAIEPTVKGATDFLNLAPDATEPSNPSSDDEGFIITDAGGDLDIDLSSDLTAKETDAEPHNTSSRDKKPSRKKPGAPQPILDLDRDHRVPFHLRASLEVVQEKRRGFFATLGLSVTILLLLTLLAAQTVFFRAEDVKHYLPEAKQYVNLACEYVPCQYSGKHDVSLIQLVSRDVRSHPAAKNALMISATFTNTAKFSQPYPRILLTLSDLAGSVVAQRIFSPQEYLGKLYDSLLLMEPETPVQVTLDVLDPGADAINFEFKFL